MCFVYCGQHPGILVSQSHRFKCAHWGLVAITIKCKLSLRILQ